MAAPVDYERATLKTIRYWMKIVYLLYGLRDLNPIRPKRAVIPEEFDIAAMYERIVDQATRVKKPSCQ